MFDKLKNKKVYTKINVIIQESNITTYKIMIVKDYLNFNLKKNDIYYVNYKLLFKCNNEAWQKIYLIKIYLTIIL